MRRGDYHYGKTPSLISIRGVLASLGRAAPVQEPLQPAVLIRRSVQQDYIVCLDCSFCAQALCRRRWPHRAQASRKGACWVASAGCCRAFNKAGTATERDDHYHPMFVLPSLLSGSAQPGAIYHFTVNSSALAEYPPPFWICITKRSIYYRPCSY
jgi:hypothetical protein